MKILLRVIYDESIERGGTGVVLRCKVVKINNSDMILHVNITFCYFFNCLKGILFKNHTILCNEQRRMRNHVNCLLKFSSVNDTGSINEWSML